jgi:predicted nucleic acid-binding protein
MSSGVILDTNVLVALVDQRDKWHVRASARVKTLVASGDTLIYFDVVIGEAIGVLGRRLEEQKRSHQFAALLDELNSTIPAKSIVWASAELQSVYTSVIDLVRQTNGVLNFNDALIAIAAREFNFKRIVTFDNDFDQVSWLARVE